MDNDKPDVSREDMAGWLKEKKEEWRTLGYVDTWDFRDEQVFQAIRSVLTSTPDDFEERVWQILFDARESLAVNKGEGKQDALADVAREIVALCRPQDARGEGDFASELRDKQFIDRFSAGDVACPFCHDLAKRLQKQNAEVK